ncbi:hypothetical protein YC2023_046175 [Brassica napus]
MASFKNEFKNLWFLKRGSSFGLVIVDVVNGFCTVGSGNMVTTNLSKVFAYLIRLQAPTKPNEQISKMMVEES